MGTKIDIKSVTLFIDIKAVPLFTGYFFGWCIRAYVFYYISLLRRSFKTMRVGNITQSIMMIPKGLVYAQRLVTTSLKSTRLDAVKAYSYLQSGSTIY